MKQAFSPAELAELKRLVKAQRAAPDAPAEPTSSSSVSAPAARRSRFLAEANKGLQFLECSDWAVCGDVLNPQMPASTVVASLRRDGKNVHLVNPHDRTRTCQPDLLSIGARVDVVNLCINSWNGMQLAKQAAQLGVTKIFIQPGVRTSRLTRRSDALTHPAPHSATRAPKLLRATRARRRRAESYCSFYATRALRCIWAASWSNWAAAGAKA